VTISSNDPVALHKTSYPRSLPVATLRASPTKHEDLPLSPRLCHFACGGRVSYAGTGPESDYLLFLDVLEIIVIPCKIRVRDLCKTENIMFLALKKFKCEHVQRKVWYLKKSPQKKGKNFNTN